jgi:hypothetical protein
MGARAMYLKCVNPDCLQNCVGKYVGTWPGIVSTCQVCGKEMLPAPEAEAASFKARREAMETAAREHQEREAKKPKPKPRRVYSAVEASREYGMYWGWEAESAADAIKQHNATNRIVEIGALQRIAAAVEEMAADVRYLAKEFKAAKRRKPNRRRKPDNSERSA